MPSPTTGRCENPQASSINSIQSTSCKKNYKVTVKCGCLNAVNRKHSDCKAVEIFEARMWPGTESNRRHEDFQSSALPTELPGHTCKNIYLTGLLWGFKRSCGRAAIIMRLDPTLGRSRQDLGRARFSAACGPRSQNSVHHRSKTLTKVKWAYSLPLRALLRNL